MRERPKRIDEIREENSEAIDLIKEVKKEPYRYLNRIGNLQSEKYLDDWSSYYPHTLYCR